MSSDICTYLYNSHPYQDISRIARYPSKFSEAFASFQSILTSCSRGNHCSDFYHQINFVWSRNIYKGNHTTRTLLCFFQYVLHFIHVSVCISSSLLFDAKSDSIIRMNITKFIYSPIDGHLDFYYEKPSNNFPKWFYYFTLPPTKSSSCFPSLPTLNVKTVSQNPRGFNL